MSAPEAFSDRALLGILASNALTLGMALVQGWGLLLLLWPFWIQSVIIGVFARRRILALERYCAEGLLYNGKALAPGDEGKKSVANFFAMHFGTFHLVYLIFLVVLTLMGLGDGVVPFQVEGSDEVIEVAVGQVQALDLLLFLGLGVAFWLTHSMSHREHLGSDLAGNPQIGRLMFLPYLRVLPMHLMILLGIFLAGGPWAVALFVVLKTLADVGMHRFEHARLRATVNIGSD